MSADEADTDPVVAAVEEPEPVIPDIDEPGKINKDVIVAGLSNIARSSGGAFVYVSLDLVGKSISALNDLKTYQELKYINVKNNQLTSVAPLSELTNLLSANLQSNFIASIDDVKNDSIQLLQLDSNKLTSFSTGNPFPSLRALTLSKNSIATLTAMNAVFPLLEVLDLSNNQLTSLEVSLNQFIILLLYF